MPPEPGADCFVISSAQGLTENNIVLATSQGTGQIGVTVQGQSIQGKQIIISGTILGRVTENRRLMQDVLTPTTELSVVYDNSLELKAFITNGPTIERKPLNANFQFTLFAPYPYWRTLEMIITDLANMIAMFEFPINYWDTYFDDPLEHYFGVSDEAKYRDVYNDGNVPAPFRVVFIARTELSTPMITLIERPVSTKFIVVEKDMVPGEVITVDMTTESMTATSKIGDVETDIFGYLGFDSTWFQLSPGSNLIQKSAERNEAGLDVKIERYTAWSGAWGDDVTYL